MLITKQQLARIIDPVCYDEKRLVSITMALNETFKMFEIDTPLRICHFLAQVLHESSAFRYSAEIWGNTEAQERYDTRGDLGNTPEVDGDGYKYRGRGWIQLAGKSNYRMVSKEFGINFLVNPDLISQKPWDSLAAGLFWSRKGLNGYAEIDDILTITKKINAGFSGLNDRKMWLMKAKAVLVKNGQCQSLGYKMVTV